MKIYKAEKILDGYSCCFRQFNANHSHCKFLHGYSLRFRLHFSSKTLDLNNWSWDFGWTKDTRYKIEELNVKEWFTYMFDHTVIVSEKDPFLKEFQKFEEKGIIQLRVIPNFSSELLAEFILLKINPIISTYSHGRAVLDRVDVIENDKNSASVTIR